MRRESEIFSGLEIQDPLI